MSNPQHPRSDQSDRGMFFEIVIRNQYISLSQILLADSLETISHFRVLNLVDEDIRT